MSTIDEQITFSRKRARKLIKRLKKTENADTRAAAKQALLLIEKFLAVTEPPATAEPTPMEKITGDDPVSSHLRSEQNIALAKQALGKPVAYVQLGSKQ